MKLPYPVINRIPDTEPEATPSLWNERYYEIDENFKKLIEWLDDAKKALADHASSRNHPAATETEQGMARIASQDEVNSGTGDATVVSPKALAARTATENRAGVIQTASQAEVDAGSVANKAITPKTLAGRTATESRTGVIQIASQTEANAGSNLTRALTPGRARGANDARYMRRQQNLSDLADKAQARTNLGLGAAATSGTTASRTDSATSKVLQAKAMNDHRTSGDHDSRYLRRDANSTLRTNAHTTLTISADDGHNATLAVHGDEQGTGRVYVGQSGSYGGGIEYNGDGSPGTTEAGSDRVTLFRRNEGVDHWTARNPHSSNVWEFREPPIVGGNRVLHTGDSIIPQGLITLWSGATTAVPGGWALCDGKNGTPDLRDRFIVGAGSSYKPGDKGGASSIKLTTDQLPAHNHSMGSAGAHSHSASTGSAGSHGHTANTESAGGHSHTASTNSAGSHGHTASTNSAGSHGHTASTNSAGSHNHKASTGSAGDHSHTGSTNTTGSHSHTFPLAENERSTADVATFGTNVQRTGTTSNSGAHSHSVSVNNSGTHAHSVSVDNGGAHSHTVSVANGGDHSHTVSVATGGAHSHTVSVASSGAHTHKVSVDSATAHSHSVSVASAAAHTHSIGNTGSGAAHENRPPYYALAYIMKL